MKTTFIIAAILILVMLFGCAATPVYDKDGKLVGSLPAVQMYVLPAPAESYRVFRPYSYNRYWGGWGRNYLWERNIELQEENSELRKKLHRYEDRRR